MKRALRWETITSNDGPIQLGHDDVAIKCKVCGQRDLHWVDVKLPMPFTGPGWDAASPRTSGFKYVPIGTSDLSGNVHSLRPETCTKGATTVVQQQGPAIVQSYDDSALKAAVEFDAKRIETLSAGLGQLNGDIRDLGNATAAEFTNRDLSLADVRNDIQTLSDAIANVRNSQPVDVRIVLPTGAVKDMGRQHHQFANAVTMLNCIGNEGALYLVGEPGSGKTYQIHLLAEALGHAHDTGYEIQSVGLETTMSQLVGYLDVTGTYRDTALYRCFTEGKVYCADEADAMRSGTGTVLNAAIANAEYLFPCGMTKKHPNFRVVFCGNTFGRGPDAQFNGRTQLDAATLDRLVYLPWNIDWSQLGERLGLSIDADTPEFPMPGQPRDLADYADWGNYVKHIRNVVQSLDMRVIVAARAAINGAALLAAGIDRDLVEYATLWGHMSTTDANTIKANL